MGAPYQSQSASGYNSSPPPDDGSTTAANKITWASIKTKLADSLKTLADAINTQLRTALNVSPSLTSTNYTTLTSDHLTTIEVTGTTTISLGDAATMIAQSMGYTVTIWNKGTGVVTVGVITGTNKLNGTANGTAIINPNQAMTFTVSQSGVDYDMISSARLGQDQWVAAGGTADAITAAYKPANLTLFDGMLCSFRATAANATTTPTFAPDGLTAHTITKKGGSAVAANDIPGNLSEVLLRYNLANTRWELLNPAPGAAVVTGVNGNIRNGKMSVTAASATGTFTADEILVETALGGSQQLLTSYSQACNLATNGAGGMDTGSAPTSGFVSLYAIAKPDGTKSILACAVATSTASIYAGANMPSGYTYSALIGIWPTNGSSQFVIGFLIDREVSVVDTVIFTATTGVTSYTSQSLSVIVPAAAKWAKGQLGSAVGSSRGGVVAADSNGTGAQYGIPGSNSGAMDTYTGSYCWRVPLITANTVYWKVSNNDATAYRMTVSGYGF